MKKIREIIVVAFIIVVLSGITLKVMADCGEPVVYTDCGPEDDLTGC